MREEWGKGTGRGMGICGVVSTSSTIGGCRTELTGGCLDLTGAGLTCGCHSRRRRWGIERSTAAREEEEGIGGGAGGFEQIGRAHV